MDWDSIQETVGTGLPKDYRWFVERDVPLDFIVYGPLTVQTFDLVEQNRESSQTYLGLQAERRLPEHDVLPQPGWLPQWAHDGSGSMHWWDTSKGTPDEWDGTPYGFAEYLVRYLTNRLAEFGLYGTFSDPPIGTPEADNRPRELRKYW
ncbi:hypothetical protein ACFQ1S_13270 [Kibdelosporangium lantanae]|uniref:SMI1/KNR4 family protein n=1 Tax=Kibdelosporangium lantanae TaxID=1497396 RepID=A0ABW3M6W2_9PSEU